MRCPFLALAVSTVLTLTSSAPAQQPPAPMAPAGQQPRPNMPEPNAKPPTTPQDVTSSTVIGGKVMEQWVKELQDKDPCIRENAVATLRLYGPAARSAVPTLIKLAADKDVSVRVNVVITLGVVGMDDRDLPAGVIALGNALRDPQAIIRFQAATALGRLGPDAKPAIPGLLTAMKDLGAWEIRKAAVGALGSAGEDRQAGPDPRSIKGLVEALGDISYMVRLEALMSFIGIGPPGQLLERQYVDRALISVSQKDSNKVCRVWAHVAIMRMDKPSDPQLAALGKYLKAQEPLVRTHAARALGTIGPGSKPQTKEVMEAVNSEQDPMPLFWMIWALGMIGDGAKSSVPTLAQFQTHKEEAIRRIAAESLERIQGKAVKK